MRCPFCQHDNDSVRDSRAVEDGRSIRRRRFCHHCKRRFTTFERVEGSLLVVKKGGEREPFSREKIERGLERACWKRQVPAEAIRQLAAEVESQISEEYELEVPSAHIGEKVMHMLAEVDQVAYVRFASVYRQFKDARDFVDELRPILKKSIADPTP
jgi:transcriptional repressor NrdR